MGRPAQPSRLTRSIVLTSTSAQPSIFRPELEIAGTLTRFLVDQIRVIDIAHIHGDPVHHLDHDEVAEVEHAVAHYLGL